MRKASGWELHYVLVSQSAADCTFLRIRIQLNLTSGSNQLKAHSPTTCPKFWGYAAGGGGGVKTNGRRQAHFQAARSVKDGVGSLHLA